jgi:hypothetical protein
LVVEGFIRQIGSMNEKNYLWINYAELLTGDEARAVAIEEGAISGDSWDEFLSYWTSSAPSETSYLRDKPWWIEREGDVVVKIEEQYLP